MTHRDFKVGLASERSLFRTLTEVPVSARHGAGSAPALRHAATDEVPADVFLTDPGLALVHADMGAWLEAHPCVCEALCECEDR